MRPGREGNRNPYLTPAEALNRRWVSHRVITGLEQWGRFCQGLGDADRESSEFATNLIGWPTTPTFKARVEARLGTASTAEWVEAFRGGVDRCRPIYEFDEVSADVQVGTSADHGEIDQPGHGRVRMLDFLFAARRCLPYCASRALLGQHTREVLEELGRKDEIERLAEAGTIQLGIAG